MNKGFLSPRLAKKAAATPRVDVNELAARITRLKNGEVENTDVSQPRQATRVVNTQSAKHSEGDSDRGTNEGVTTNQVESVPIDVEGTFIPPIDFDSQVKPVSLVDNASDSNGSSGIKVDNLVGDVSQGAAVGHMVNVKDNVVDSEQPSVSETQPNVEQCAQEF